MSRMVNVKDPDSWTDEDKVYLRERVETVPPEHRDKLDLPPVLAPEALAQHPDIVKLTRFLKDNFPEDMQSGLPAVDVAISLLSEDDVSDAPPDDYDNWKVAELRSEADNRQPPVAYTTTTKKEDLVAALRSWDAEHSNG